ncbi:MULTISPECIES: hypothetical protein [Bradyrhizobium]|nr:MULTISPECIES: hypothetical protein [Bradyrhizobium]
MPAAIQNRENRSRGGADRCIREFWRKWRNDNACAGIANRFVRSIADFALFATLVSVALVMFSPIALAADQLQVYIRAFIPKNHSSVRPLPNSGGGTMVQPPGSSIVGCFPTDQRTFSTEIRASSRVASIATVDPALPGGLIKQEHPSNESNAVDCGDGSIINREKTDTSDQKFTFVPAGTSKIAQLKIHASGHNPNFQWAPAIDIDGIFFIDLGANTIRFEGSVDQYPAYEAYVTYNGNVAVPILQIMPDYGKTALDLAFTKSVKTNAVKYK